MNRHRKAAAFAALVASLTMGACMDGPIAPESSVLSSMVPGGQPVVLVNPGAQGAGNARTIGEAIAMVAPGGTVRVLPGTYAEALVIDRGLTIEAIGGASGAVIIDPLAGTTMVIRIATTEPVTLRGLTVHVPGADGIAGMGPVNLTVERSSVLVVEPKPAPGDLIRVANQTFTGQRASLVVRHSTLDALSTPPIGQTFGVRATGDIDALIEGNVIRRTGGACIVLATRIDLAGELNADIQDNDLDDCQPIGRVAAIIVGPPPMVFASPDMPITTTGVVNIVGNVIRNSSGSCLTGSAIVYELFTGRIEHNRIHDVVQECATGSPRNLPSAIWLGGLRPNGSHVFFPPVTPTVRFNDIAGNAHAGIRIAPNQTIVIDATCNFWGATDGPSGVGPGSGDAVVVEAGGVPPVVQPFASAPIAATKATSC
jgi:hypothetical protein